MKWGDEDEEPAGAERARVVSVNVSPGGKPKTPVLRGRLSEAGFDGDGREHSHHYKPDRAVSLIDAETFPGMGAGGGAAYPGELGENLTVQGLNARNLPLGARLRFAGGVEIEITSRHKPCSSPTGEPRIIGCFARVITPGDILPGEAVTVQEEW